MEGQVADGASGHNPSYLHTLDTLVYFLLLSYARAYAMSSRFRDFLFLDALLSRRC